MKAVVINFQQERKLRSIIPTKLPIYTSKLRHFLDHHIGLQDAYNGHRRILFTSLLLCKITVCLLFTKGFFVEHSHIVVLYPIENCSFLIVCVSWSSSLCPLLIFRVFDHFLFESSYQSSKYRTMLFQFVKFPQTKDPIFICVFCSDKQSAFFQGTAIAELKSSLPRTQSYNRFFKPGENTALYISPTATEFFFLFKFLLPRPVQLHCLPTWPLDQP